MVVGILSLELSIPMANSLKDKRMVLNRIKDRVRQKFNVSIAETEANDVWNFSGLGVAIVSNDQKFANQVLSQVVNLVETVHDCSLDDMRMEFLHVD